MRSLRVCLVSTDFPPHTGGVGNHVSNLALALVKRGHEVSIIASSASGPLLHTELGNSGRLYRIRTSYRGARWGFPATAIVVTLRHRVDIVHPHTASSTDFWASQGIRARGRVFTNHTSEFVTSANDLTAPLRRYLRAMNRADRVIVPSRELGFLSVKSGVPTSKVRYIPNGVDVGRFTVGERPLEDNATVVSVRRLVPKNGLDLLIRSWPLVLREHPSARLILVGDGPQRAELLTLAKGSGVLGSIDLLGDVPNDEVPSILLRAHVSAIPSRIEATSIACLEAMASGLPIVGTRVGGIPELVMHGINGFLVGPDNHIQFASALTQLLSDPALRARFGKCGRELATAKFSWNNIAAQTESVYAEALSGLY